MAITAPKRATPTVAGAVEQFIALHRHERGVTELISILQGPRSGRTVGKRASGVSLANSPLGSLRFDRPNSKDFADWLYQRFPETLAPSTRKKGRSALNQLLIFAIRSGWADERILVSLPSFRASPPRREWVRPEQLAALNVLVTRCDDDHLTSRQRFMWFCLQNVGLRPAELVTLKPSALNPADRTLKVMGKGRGEGKPRAVPVSESFIADWQAYVTAHLLKPTSWLFPVMRVRFVEGERYSYERDVADASKHCTPKAVRTAVNKVHELAIEAVKNRRLDPSLLPPILTPKVLRRTYACTHLILASEGAPGEGMDIRSLQDAMGHESLETTAIYLSDVSAYLSRRRRAVSVADAVAQLARAA
jgi:site-specific recombinase XerD